MKTIWIFLWRLIAFPWLGWGGYRALSYVYRFFWQRKYKDVPVDVYRSMDELVAKLAFGQAWRQDSWKALWDSIGYPGRTQRILSGIEPQPKTDLDCDDFAIFVAHAIEHSRRAEPILWSRYQKAHFFTVTWMDGWVIKGHNVCLLEVRTDEGTKYAYMDYDYPTRLCNNISEVAEIVRRKYSDKTHEPIVWMVSDLNLKPTLTQWGEPT